MHTHSHMQTHVHTHTQSQFRIEFLLKMGSVLLQLDHETQQRITTASHRVGMLAQECNTLRGLSRRRVDLRKRLPLHVIKLQALSEVYQQRERARCAEKNRRSAALQTVCDAFSGPGHAYNGADLASESVKQKIKQLIAKEDENKPLSDQKLCNLLKEDGLEIARRTVAKYREI